VHGKVPVLHRRVRKAWEDEAQTWKAVCGDKSHARFGEGRLEKGRAKILPDSSGKSKRYATPRWPPTLHQGQSSGYKQH
jgi:hypothetical protein